MPPSLSLFACKCLLSCGWGLLVRGGVCGCVAAMNGMTFSIDCRGGHQIAPFALIPPRSDDPGFTSTAQSHAET